MSKLDTAPYKGVRDFYPEDMRIQNYIFGVWRKIMENAGYQEYGASVLEPADLYKSKTSEEIVSQQTFSFVDRGGREVVLRPEMTPTLARMVAARRRELVFPLRWYSIPNLFRYEQPQRGRKREHWQLNCDLLGIADSSAEVEIVSLAYKILKGFGAQDGDFIIKVNSRKLLQEAYAPILIDPSRPEEMFRLIDRKEKMSEEEFHANWGKLFTTPFRETQVSDSPRLTDILQTLEQHGVRAVFDPWTTRGFDYYTDVVFEVFDTHEDNRRSLLGGGRYDNLLEIFGVEPVPTVGFGMGDITVRDFLESHKLGPYA